MAANIITLTTDFGTADSYAPAMKGVMLSINPACTIIDITHDIAPRDIRGACFALSACYRYFPGGTIHVAVVDPGVGSARRPILIETDDYLFVGPDNGLFSFALAGQGVKNVFELTNASCFIFAVRNQKKPHPIGAEKTSNKSC
ncbi:MAG: SAM-dependent chlorinase/fluorinase [Pseudomonadota bacterium]